MSDISDTGNTSAPDPAPDAGSFGDDGLTMPDGQQLFDRSYVTKLRDEAANWRTQLREVQERASRYEVLDRYDDADRQVWIELAQSWEQDPYQAAAAMRQIAERVLGDIEQQQQQPGNDSLFDGDDDDDLSAMTPEKVQEIVAAELARQAEEAELEAAVEGVYGEIRQAGIDPTSPDGFMVLWRASNQTNGDVAKALEQHQQYKQSIINEFIAAKSGAGAVPPVANGIAGAERPQVANLDDAFAAGRAFLERGNGLG